MIAIMISMVLIFSFLILVLCCIAQNKLKQSNEMLAEIKEDISMLQEQIDIENEEKNEYPETDKVELKAVLDEAYSHADETDEEIEEEE